MVVYYYFGFYKVILLNFVIMRFDEILWCSYFILRSMGLCLKCYGNVWFGNGF